MKPKTDQARQPQEAGIVRWPEGAAALTGISAPTLQRKRSQGDAPQLYAVSERALVTTEADLLAWIRAKAVPAGYQCRPPTISRGTKRQARRAAEAGPAPAK